MEAPAADEKRALLSACAVRDFCRASSTSRNCDAASRSLSLRPSTTVDECCCCCCAAAEEEAAAALLLAPTAASSLRAPLSPAMSLLIRAERSAISAAGSSKELVLRARAASAFRRSLVAWIPAPTAAARRAKSDWAEAVEEAAESGLAEEVIEEERVEEEEGPKEAERGVDVEFIAEEVSGDAAVFLLFPSNFRLETHLFSSPKTHLPCQERSPGSVRELERGRRGAEKREERRKR